MFVFFKRMVRHRKSRNTGAFIWQAHDGHGGLDRTEFECGRYRGGGEPPVRAVVSRGRSLPLSGLVSSLLTD